MGMLIVLNHTVWRESKVIQSVMCFIQSLAQTTKVMLISIIDCFPPLKCKSFKVRDCVMTCLLIQYHWVLWYTYSYTYGSVKLTFILKFITFKFQFNPITDWIYACLCFTSLSLFYLPCCVSSGFFTFLSSKSQSSRKSQEIGEKNKI